jgi:hypothetical protein
MTTLSATSSRPKSKTLTVCEVLAYSRTIFHPYMCELRGGDAAIAAVLIGYVRTRSLMGRGCGGGDHNQLLPLN